MGQVSVSKTDKTPDMQARLLTLKKHIDSKESLGYFILLLLLTTLLFTACSKEEKKREINDETIRADFQAIELTPGVQDISLEVAEGVFYNFRMIVPDVDMTKKWPLIMAFHGESNGDPNAHKTTECYIEPGFEDIDAFIIHANADTYQWYENFNQNKVRSLLTLATTYWPIDFSKIAATGYSNGGNMSWLMAENASNIFTASIPIASSYDISVDANTGRKINIPMYVIHGEKDELFPIDVTKNWVDLSVAAGSDITFVQADNLTHFKPCDYVPYIKEAVVWLKDQWN